MSKPIRRNLINLLVLVLLSISVVPTLMKTQQWELLNYATAGALVVVAVWVLADAARSVTRASR